jgi:hypothetical protein
VKPDIVFFGEGLPDKFFQSLEVSPAGPACLLLLFSLWLFAFAVALLLPLLLFLPGHTLPQLGCSQQLTR